jgi:ArsR family transcriptional regulator
VVRPGYAGAILGRIQGPHRAGLEHRQTPYGYAADKIDHSVPASQPWPASAARWSAVWVAVSSVRIGSGPGFGPASIVYCQLSASTPRPISNPAASSAWLYASNRLIPAGTSSHRPVESPRPATARSPRSSAEAAGVLSLAFKALGDPIRLQLMSMIASAPDGEICVCDLTPAFELTGQTISHHLKVLRDAGLVESSRRGTWAYYRLKPDAVRELRQTLGG